MLSGVGTPGITTYFTTNSAESFAAIKHNLAIATICHKLYRLSNTRNYACVIIAATLANL